jgi:hypothetical protein
MEHNQSFSKRQQLAKASSLLKHKQSDVFTHSSSPFGNAYVHISANTNNNEQKEL